MNLERRAVYFRGIHADVRARGRNNKPPPPLSASGATGGMYTRRGDLLFMYKKKYNHTARCYISTIRSLLLPSTFLPSGQLTL